jgi:hypothetical protein
MNKSWELVTRQDKQMSRKMASKKFEVGKGMPSKRQPKL